MSAEAKLLEAMNKASTITASVAGRLARASGQIAAVGAAVKFLENEPPIDFKGVEKIGR